MYRCCLSCLCRWKSGSGCPTASDPGKLLLMKAINQLQRPAKGNHELLVRRTSFVENFKVIRHPFLQQNSFGDYFGTQQHHAMSGNSK